MGPEVGRAVMTQDLLDEVLAHPDDDVPRRILADWLSERGDPRGELIAVQCELAVRGAHDPERRDLERRELDLLKAHGNRWIAELGLTDVKAARPRGPIEHMVGPTVVFRRGFPDEASLPVANAAVAMSAFSSTPLRRLVVTDLYDAAIAELAAQPPIRSLTSLRLRDGHIHARSLLALGDGQFTSTIESLVLQRIAVGRVDEFVNGRFPAMRSLDLDEIEFGQLHELAHAVWLPALRTLRISISSFPTMEFLLGDRWRDLTTLYLRASSLDTSLFVSLAGSRIAQLLEYFELWLGYRDVRPAVIAAFAMPDHFPKLEKLVLHDTTRGTDITPLVERWGPRLIVA
jgi:uncharacterized protein (TIGR02996 family)